MKRILFVLMCLSIFVVACEVKNPQDGIDNDFESTDLVDSGMEKMKNKDFQGAIDSFAKASETDDDPNILSFLAKAKLLAGDGNGALDAINKALDIKIERPYYLARAEIQLFLKNFKDASSDIEKATAISDDDSWPHYILSNIKFESGNNKEALDSINMALSKGNDMQSNKVLYYEHMANIKYTTKDYQGALNAINQALEGAQSLENTEERFPPEAISNFYTKRSKIKFDMGDESGSVEDIEKAKSSN